MTCQCCRTKAPIKYVEFHQNIGLLYVRFHSNIKGNLCKRCINRYFWGFTTVNLIFGWWGVISFFITPFLIVNNFIYYLGAWSMSPAARKTPNPRQLRGKFRMSPPPARQTPPISRQEAIDRLAPHAHELISRLKQGENPERVKQLIAFLVGISRQDISHHAELLDEIMQYVADFVNSSNVRPDLNVDLNLGFYEAVTPKASADFDNIKASLDRMAQLGWFQEESSWSANFTIDSSELSELDRLDRVVKALLDCARRVAPGFSVPMMVPRVVVESMPAAAGQFEVDEEGWVTIRVSPDFERDLPTARAILAHEVCHYILENRGIRQPNVELNERDTDLCMFICGFGDVFLAGYKRSSARNEYRPGHRLGYLTDAEYQFANHYTKELRVTYRQNLQSELAVLKERLLRKALGDRDRVRRLIEYERQRDRSLSELELYRDAIARFDRD